MRIARTGGSTIVRPNMDTTPGRSWVNWVLGHPLATADAPNETVGKMIGLAVFASDALSSTAYATQEMLFVLAAAGAAAFGLAFPLSLLVIALLALVTFSFHQSVQAYPGGGGAYTVARDNLGELPAQTTGAALLVDYVLTVAVSISAGSAQIVSAYPGLYPYRAAIAVGLVLLIMVVNLRGVKESGTLSAFPTFFFLVMIFLTVGAGLLRYLSGHLGAVVNPPDVQTAAISVVGPFLLLHAFAAGTTALTGVEAISNGVTAFKEPRRRNAGVTLIWMSAILAALFLGISFLATRIGAVPSDYETVVSQLARTAFGGRALPYLLTIAGTTVILIMAANTSFADFPRLGAVHAGDGFLPRQFTYRGSRLVYSWGIVALAAVASLLIVVFNSSVTRLIPLYVISVFLSFTLSQAGMARRWWKAGHLSASEEVVEAASTLRYQPRWQWRMAVSGFGALCTLVVVVVFAVTRFRDGAWVVLVLIPALVVVLFSIHRHYDRVARRLSLVDYEAAPFVARHRVIVPFVEVDRATVAALSYATVLSSDVTAVHVSMDDSETKKVSAGWDEFGNGTRLVILESPYRRYLEPLLEYINTLVQRRQPGEVISIVVPQAVPGRWWQNILHAQTARFLRWALLFKPGIVIIEVPFQV